MTEEQIKELDRLDVPGLQVWGATDGVVTTMTTTPGVARAITRCMNALPRLLEERKRLLEALREATLFHSVDDHVRARAALACGGGSVKGCRIIMVCGLQYCIACDEWVVGPIPIVISRWSRAQRLLKQFWSTYEE